MGEPSKNRPKRYDFPHKAEKAAHGQFGKKLIHPHLALGFFVGDPLVDSNQLICELFIPWHPKRENLAHPFIDSNQLICAPKTAHHTSPDQKKILAKADHPKAPEALVLLLPVLRDFT